MDQVMQESAAAVAPHSGDGAIVPETAPKLNEVAPHSGDGATIQKGATQSSPVAPHSGDGA